MTQPLHLQHLLISMIAIDSVLYRSSKSLFEMIWAKRFLLCNADRFVKSSAINRQYFEPCRRVARTLLQFQLGANAQYGEAPRLFRHAEPISVLGETTLETEGLNSQPGLGFCWWLSVPFKFSLPAEAGLLCKDVESPGLLSGV